MKQIINLDALRRLAGSRSFSRGEDYFNRDLVRSLSEHNGVITAKVKGTHTYTVTLREDNGDLDYSCTCPMGDDGSFCKHCVAVGLSWLEQKTDGKDKKAGRRDRVDLTMKDVKGYLESLEKKALVEMVLEQAGESDVLCERLMMQAARKSTGGCRPAALKKIIREAIVPGDFIGYYEMRNYAAEVCFHLADGKGLEVETRSRQQDRGAPLTTALNAPVAFL